MNKNKNTKEEALTLLKTLIKDKDLISHSIEVSNVSLDICKAMNIQGEQSDLICSAAILHDIGLSHEIRKHNFPAIDAFLYLKEKNWDKFILNIILHHSESKYLAERTRPDLAHFYRNNPLPASAVVGSRIVTMANFRVNGLGERITAQKRIREIKEKYGESAESYKVAKVCYNSLKYFPLDF